MDLHRCPAVPEARGLGAQGEGRLVDFVSCMTIIEGKTRKIRIE